MDESIIELAASAWFETLRIHVLDAAEVDEDPLNGPASFFLSGPLTAALQRLNESIPVSALESVQRTLRNPPYPTFVNNNRWFYQQLTDGVEVEYQTAAGETKQARTKLIDFDDPRLNDYRVIRQMSVTGPAGKLVRPDLIFFINGIPLAIIELKSPTRQAASIDAAIAQVKRYGEVAPNLFLSNLLLIASDGATTRVGTVSSGNDRFQPWRSVYAEQPTLEGAIRGIFDPSLFLDLLRNCVVYTESVDGSVTKLLAGYHQFRAMRSARASVLSNICPPVGSGDGRGGVVWHTQGSGKSLTMLMLSGALIREPRLANPTIVIVTDRNDLDDQLFATFAQGRSLLRQDPVQAESRAHLTQLLTRPSGGVVFTTIFKFTEEQGELSKRPNIVVIADEAHRSQYGFVEGGARWMRKSLPNATFVGFTGTPLERSDKNTIQVFGDYCDIYDIRQAVDDGATKPLFYESRIVQLSVDRLQIKEAEAELNRVAAADECGAEISPDVKVPLEILVGAPSRLAKIARFVVEHWEQRRCAFEGKGMVVTMSRDIAARLYNEIVALRPEWHSDSDDEGYVKVVISGTGFEETPLKEHVRGKYARRRLADRFRDPYDSLRLVIVCDMWLTGFDCPAAHTIYIDKPLAGHNLMQTIARVNRVFGDKPGGLVVDLIGLTDQLADAIATYTRAGGTGEAIQQVQESAVPAMLSALEKLEAFFYGCDYRKALEVEPTLAPEYYLAAADHALGQPDGWTRLRALVKELALAFSLSVPRPETDSIAPQLAFFQRLVVLIKKRVISDEFDSPANPNGSVEAAVRQVIGGTINAGEVLDLFQIAGLGTSQIGILSEDFLCRVGALPQKNIALEALRKLLTDQITLTERTNVAQSKLFREALEEAMLRYTNKALTTAEMVTQLLDLARELRSAKEHGDSLGLSAEETAFYDALAENGSAKEVMKDETLRLMARELVEMVKQLPKLDWSQRESVRAGLRRSVRRLLAKYGYPPDLSADATQLVVRQAELSTQDLSD